MWIRTQNKQRIINSDQIIDIFVGKSGTKIVANTTCYDLDASEVVLGEYKDRDTCIMVLNKLLKLSICRYAWEEMPFDGDVKSWVKDIEDNC